MKKKGLMVLAVALSLAMVPVASFGASSKTLTAVQTGTGKHSSGGSSGGGSSVGSSGAVVSVGGVAVGDGTTTSSSVSSTAGSTSVTLSDGTILNLSHAVVDSATGYVHGLVEGSASEIRVGEGKIAGLPDYIISMISAVDDGQITAIPGIDTQGYNKASQSMAIINESGEAMELTLYCTNIPDEGTLAIMFYNNYNSEISILPATSQDLVNKTVSFIAPVSGTAWIIAK